MCVIYICMCIYIYAFPLVKYHDLGSDFHCGALWAQSGGVPKRHLLLTDPSVPHQQHSPENPELQDFGLSETLFWNILNDKRCQ